MQDLQDFLEFKVSAEELYQKSQIDKIFKENINLLKELNIMSGRRCNMICIILAVLVIVGGSLVGYFFKDLAFTMIYTVSIAISAIFLIGFKKHQKGIDEYLSKISSSYIEGLSLEEFKKELIDSILDSMIISISNDLIGYDKSPIRELETKIYTNTLVRLLNQYNEHVPFINLKYGESFLTNFYDTIFNRMRISGDLQNLVVKYIQK